MKLSMSLIAKYLDHYRLESDLRDDRLEIRGVRFLSDSRLSLSPEYAYIGKADQYFSDKQYAGVCMIVGGKSRIMCYSCDYEELLNDLLGAFEYYNEWELKLNALALKHRPLAEFMEIIRETVDSPITVMDLDGYIIASSNLERADFPGTEYMREHNQMASWMMSEKIEDMQGRVISDVKHYPQRYRLQGMPHTNISMYLHNDGEPVGFWQIYEALNQQQEYHIQLQAFLAPLLVQADEFYASDSMLQSNRSVMLRLLNGETPPDDVQAQFLSIVNLTMPSVLMQIHNLTIRNYTQRSMFVRDLNQLKLNCFALDYQGDVIIVLPKEKQATVVREMTALLGTQNVAVGISMPVYSLKDLPIAYRQTVFTLNYRNGPGVYTCQDYAMEYLLENLRNQDMVSDLLHPAIGTLIQYDRENRTDLLETLRVYMMEDKSQLETAKRLHTHRNTVKYRLERIDQLTGLDFSNWNERNYLILSLLLQNPINPTE